jgi:FlaA1/EpsC-like NDP-sugar epimerase
MAHAVRIADLARTMAKVLRGGKCDYVHVGPRPGEKLYEELLSSDEQARAVDVERLLVIMPPAETQYPDRPSITTYPHGRPVDREWHSGKDTLMTPAEIEAYLAAQKLLAPYLVPGGGLS